MQQTLLQAWRNKSLWLWLLLPVSWLYGLVFWLNKTMYRLGLKPVYYPNVPVIVVGNITVGGSGKTPLIIEVVTYLQQKGLTVGVISRGYGGQAKLMPCIVTANSKPSEVGDEPCLIVQRTGVPMAVCPNRGQAIELLLEQFPSIQLILADDGLQHFALDRDENWIVVDADRGFGNCQLLPTGFLREPIKRLYQPNTTVIFHQSDWQDTQALTHFSNSLSKDCHSISPDIRMHLLQKPLEPLFKTPLFKTASQNSLPAQQVIAMTGIGLPQRFFNSLSQLGFDIIPMALNDHHTYSLQDFANLPKLPIIVTDKDAVKLRVMFAQGHEKNDIATNIWVLPVEAELSPAFYALIDRQIGELVTLTDNTHNTHNTHNADN
ncbi:tetraacyldisaccharide 4'-kinase [Moraxella osloensis]|uniref:tetraacyldisaccharide 4'-kinase n=1 Tax=Faucicola osloensis TaxID=34062 RepID=UPI00242F18B0|nr:tetraacyldisaccharide 4'-kinase [Moraxella osloensis]